ncbi:MAG: DUF1223 domain-containing protein [Allomuricauda sp.]|nr:MAG: DUF1223 domain-containing protein [Allomuricauda sp.]
MYKKIMVPILGMAVLFTVAMVCISGNKVESTITEVKDGPYAPIVVLELFTSQGCSSCPPADKVLDEAKKRFPNEVFALSYHVDYWNYIGWEDPFSQSVFTKKQSFYNRKFGYRGNYTPELVINGKEHLVGSNRTKVFSKINGYKEKGAQQSIAIHKVQKQGTTINFDYTVEGISKDSELRAVLVLNERITAVKRGENRNRTLKNSNIVLTEKYIDFEKVSGKGTIAIPAFVTASDELTLVVLAENSASDITAAAKQKV